MADDSELDKPMIVNWALAELGMAANFTIGDTTPLSDKVRIFWPRAVAHCFALADWTFCRKTFRLVRLEAAPDTGYRYQFSLPGGRIGEPMKLLSDPRSGRVVRDFRIEGNELSADAPDVWAVCKMATDLSDWDMQFANAFAVALASYLAVPLTQDIELAEAKAVQAFGTRSEGGAGGLFGRLIAQNKAAHPPFEPLYQDDPLTAGRAADCWHGRY
ncbi:MAG: hypothetical protein KIS96_14465 [Bauldia sp.]|nr:hypothetical protein [Bauldia sp.]